MISQRISLMIFVLSLSYHSRVTNGQTFCKYVYSIHIYVSTVLLVNVLLECLNFALTYVCT